MNALRVTVENESKKVETAGEQEYNARSGRKDRVRLWRFDPGDNVVTRYL